MKVTDGQLFALIKLCGNFLNDRQGRLFLLSNLIGRNIDTTRDIEIPEWQKIRNIAYPNWMFNDWNICKEFKHKCLVIKEKYEEEVLGQMKLFKRNV